MARDNATAEAIDALGQIDGIEVNTTEVSGQRLAKVYDEAAVGAFFAHIRRHGLETSSVTRGDLDETVLDGWVHL